MIDVSFEEAVRRISEETGLSVAEIQSRINDKLKSLAGLISRDGAAHILANELGVQLTKLAPQQGASLKINEITIASRGIVVSGRVVKKYDVKAFNKNGREGKVASLLLGDETGVTRLVFWNEQVDVFEELKDGDILVVKNPFVKQSYMQDRLELQLNTQSALTVNPEGVEVAAREFQRTERPPAVQKYIKDLGDDENVELIATIVQVYDPRFFDSCPKCNKKVLGENQCPEHGEVIPSVNFSMSAFLDDGTGTIRTSFWKQQAIKLTGKTEAEFVRYRDEPTAFEDVKNDLLGEFVKVVGKCKRNETFDRLEFTAQLVFTDVDPAAELANLEKKFGTKPAEPKPTEPKTTEPEKPKSDSDEISVVEDDIISLDELEDVEK
jgi:ssDNA-binding replication factor A large subunit